MNYTIHQLRVFQSICKHKSITKASEELFLTQPAVSIQLKRFQDQFDIPLTEVIGRQLYVTDFGEKISEVSSRILQEAEALKSTSDQYMGLLSGKVKISVVSTGKYVIPYFIKHFVEAHPKVDLSIDVTNKNQVVESLQKNETDFALVSVLPDHIQIETLELLDNALFLVGDSDFAERKEHLSPKALEKYPAIFREKGSATRMAMESYYTSHKIVADKTLELVSNEAVKQAVNAGLGVSIMPLIGLRNELKDGSMCIIPMKGLPIVTRWNLIHLKGKRLSPAALELRKFIEAHRAEIVAENFSWVSDSFSLI